MGQFRLKPYLVLFFPCEDAIGELVEVEAEEASSEMDVEYTLGGWVIRKPLHVVYMPRGITKGFGTPETFLYFQVTGGRGRYDLVVDFHRVDLAEPKKSMLLGWSDTISIACEHEGVVIEDTVRFPELPFPTPGLYRFRMRERGTVLDGGECYLRVFSGEPA